MLSVLAALISYRTRRLTRRLAGSLTFSAAAFFYCPLQFPCVQSFYMLHALFASLCLWLATRITLVWVYIVIFVIIAYFLSTCKATNNSSFDFSKKRLSYIIFETLRKRPNELLSECDLEQPTNKILIL